MGADCILLIVAALSDAQLHDLEALARSLAPVQQQVNDVLFACLDRKGFERLRALAAELVGCGDRAASLIDYLSSNHAAAAGSRAA